MSAKLFFKLKLVPDKLLVIYAEANWEATERWSPVEYQIKAIEHKHTCTFWVINMYVSIIWLYVPDIVLQDVGTPLSTPLITSSGIGAPQPENHMNHLAFQSPFSAFYILHLKPK